MKLAEALILRADLQRRLEQLKKRAIENARVQEGDEPAEDPGELLDKINTLLEELVELIKRINLTNNSTSFDGDLSLADALAKRDGIIKKRSILSDIAEEASLRNNRYSNSEIKYTSTLNVSDLQDQITSLSEEWRIIDTEIQRLNWNIDLI